MKRFFLLAPFVVLAALMSLSPAMADVVIDTAYHRELGTILVDGDGMTLYLFTPDEPGKSVCYGGCAVIWPPILVEPGESVVAPDAVAAGLGVIQRTDGSSQLTYNGYPLYGWVVDEKPGDITGHGVDNEWFVVHPTPTVQVAEHPEHGRYLVDAHGMTLYLFTNDEPNVSNCSGACAVNWPPLLVAYGGPIASADLQEGLGVITRASGETQVTYKGQPLYLWIRDNNPGETTGHGVNNVWYVVQP